MARRIGPIHGFVLYASTLASMFAGASVMHMFLKPDLTLRETNQAVDGEAEKQVSER